MFWNMEFYRGYCPPTVTSAIKISLLPCNKWLENRICSHQATWTGRIRDYTGTVESAWCSAADTRQLLGDRYSAPIAREQVMLRAPQRACWPSKLFLTPGKQATVIKQDLKPGCSINPSDPFCTNQCIFHHSQELTFFLYASHQEEPQQYPTPHLSVEYTLQQERPWGIVLLFPVRCHFFSSFGKGNMFIPSSDTNFSKSYEVELPSLWFCLWDCRSFQIFPNNHHSSWWTFVTFLQPTS